MIIFILAIVALFFTTFLDLKSTFIALKNPRIHEANPLMRPFVKRGQLASYLFTSVFNGAMVLLCYWVKSITGVGLAWCAIPLIVGALVHFWAYKHNQKNYLL